MGFAVPRTNASVARTPACGAAGLSLADYLTEQLPLLRDPAERLIGAHHPCGG
jgi:hypothetical protein